MCGDIGAAANLIRNILLLSPDVHYPFDHSRLDRILNQYPDHLAIDKQQWIFIEAKFRFFQHIYNVDLSFDLNWEHYQNTVKNADKPGVFINHSFVYDLDNFFVFLKNMPTLIVMPITDFGLEWQVRAYCEKKGVDIMHNFTFADNVAEQKEQFIQQHGHEAWCIENIQNMKHIIKERRDSVVKSVDQDAILPLEWLIQGDDAQTLHKLTQRFDIDLDAQDAVTVLQTWRSRHWPLEETMNWKYA